MQSKQILKIFPTSRSIREYVNSKKEFNSLLPAIFTIDEFFKKSLFFSNKKIIDEEDRFLFLKEAVKNINLKSLGISHSFSSFLKQSEYIYRFFLELSSENIQIDDISTMDTYDFYNEHLGILKVIRANYIKILVKNKAVDKITMPSSYRLNKEFLSRYSLIVINFEGYFTNFEFEIVKEISKVCEVQINFIYNQLNKKSIDKIINEGFDLKIGFEYKINFTNKKILYQNEIKNFNKKILIKSFSNRTSQIAFIKKSITDLVNRGIDSSKIALILPDETFVSTLQLFDKEHYFNFAMGLNIYNSKLYKTLDCISSYINENEIKNSKNIEFLNLNKEEIENLFEKNWNKKLSKNLYVNICNYLLEKEENKELKEKFQELIYTLEKLLFSKNEVVLLKEAFKILINKVSKLTLDDINSGKITVMGLLESRFIYFDTVIICDFNERLIPKRSLKDKFFSTSMKQKVNLPTALDRENLQKYYYERLIKNSKNAYISYVKNENDSISRFATTLFNKEIDEETSDNSYKHILYNSKNLKHFDEKVVLDINLSKISWSASSLRDFLECKRKYYLKSMIKIKEHNIFLEPQAYELGSIIHNTLEQFYKEQDHSYEKLVKIFDKYRSQNSFLNLDLEIWKKKLKDFIFLDKKRLEEGFEILELEEPFSCKFENIQIQGKIDRIDKLDDTYYVIDYKTSSNLKLSTKRTYEKSFDFQLVFYYLALKNIYNSSKIKAYYYDLYEMRLKEELVIQEKLELLKNIFSEFKTTSISFNRCENQDICRYCAYKTICNRG